MNRRGAQLQVPYHWKFMPLASVDAAGVQNTWYTVLDTTLNARFFSLYTSQVNDETAAKTVETRVTMDGVSMASSGFSHVNAAVKGWRLRTDVDYFTNVAAGTGVMAAYYAALHARSLKVEIRNTDAAGTNQHLYGYVRYATLEVAPS